MIEVFRLVENQARVYGWRVTLNEEEAVQLESILEESKPRIDLKEWDELIATPFRYPLPVLEKYQTRFCPPFSKRNAFYCSEQMSTSVHEYSYHFMRQRIHLQVSKRRKVNETGVRTCFTVDLNECPNVDVNQSPRMGKIISRTSYVESHQFVEQNKDTDIIRYPSARDPNQCVNYAVFKIDRLGKKPISEKQFNYFYDYSKKTIYWIDQKITISWEKVF